MAYDFEEAKKKKKEAEERRRKERKEHNKKVKREYRLDFTQNNKHLNPSLKSGESMTDKVQKLLSKIKKVDSEIREVLNREEPNEPGREGTGKTNRPLED